MDEVLEKFGTALSSQEPTESKTSFDGLYKNWGKYGSLGNQEERRKELLGFQKTDRNSKLDRFRGILEIVNDVEDENIFIKERMIRYKPTSYVPGFHRPHVNAYDNVLMLSEWMVEKPEDFHENWYVTPCPKGTRTLVVASHGSTKCYSKFGHFILEVRTALPGGNTSHPRFRSQCCVLDCFYQEKTKTMYVLDLLALNNQPMTDGETEFRHFWMQTQLHDIENLKEINKKNQIRFVFLPKVQCDMESFQKFMMTWPHFDLESPGMDGLLFYHKHAHYVAGQTPLVGWLYPFMVPEVLGNDIKINEFYLMDKPVDYKNQADFIQKFEAKLAKGKLRGKYRKNSNSMDTADSSQETKVRPPIQGGNKKQPIQTGTLEETTTQSMDAETTPSNNCD